ncbi:uncharacterized protein [Maniola hyperantus]|uniref:uncharacterized protein isoform X2 n=1 Tax=Aphantopus hyperantus TaxID=2795564 RepID=UPI00374881D8
MQSFCIIRMLFLYLVFQLVFVATCASVLFEDCGSAYDLHTVNIQGCGMRLPCFVTLGDRIPVNVRFLAEPCETVMCPVRTDAETSFTSVMSVPTNMALNQRGYLQWHVYNEMGQRVLCYRVMVQTQNFLQKFVRQYLALLLDGRVGQLGKSFSRNTFNTTQYFKSSILISKLIR